MNTKNEISERFIQVSENLIKAGCVADKKDFAAKIGVSPSMVTEISKGRSSVGITAVQNIVSVFGVSSEWLVTGKGEMFGTANEVKEYPSFSDNSLLLNEDSAGYTKSSVKSVNGIPLIPVGEIETVLAVEKPVFDCGYEQYVIPSFERADFLTPVTGDGMCPQYNGGDIVACRYIPKEGLFFQWNKVYLIKTAQGVFFKRVQAGSDKEHVLIVSDNENYSSFELSYADIYSVALVVGVIRVE